MIRSAATAAAIALVLLGPVGAWAQPIYLAQQQQQEEQQREGNERRQSLVPLSRVIEQLQRRTPGRQLDVRQENSSNGPIYRIVWSTNDGRRIDYVIDAETGRILQQRGG